MALRWVAKNVSPIAVDFGTDTLKLLQVSTDEQPQLLAAASISIPEGVRKTPQTRMEFVQGVLRDLVRKGGFRGNRVIMSIPTTLTHIQHLRVNKGEEQLDRPIHAQLQQRFAVDPSALLIRPIVVGEVLADGAAKQEVICIATGRQTVGRLLETASRAKLTVVGIHAEPLAIVESFAHLFRRADDTQRTTMFIDIGAGITKAMITHGTQLVFAKTIQVTAADLANALPSGSNEQTGQSQAEQLAGGDAGAQPEVPDATTADGQPADGPDESMALLDAAASAQTATTVAKAALPAAASADPQGPGPTAAPASAQVSEMLDCLVDELQLCVGYHASMFQNQTVQKLVFLGGGANDKPVCQHIARSLRIPAQLGDPLARLNRASGASAPVGVDLRQSQPGWAVPLGLCSLPTNL